MLTEVIKHSHKQGQNACDHQFQAIGNVSHNTAGVCEECTKERTTWVALRMCLSCGRVGCFDSSPGMHASRHYVETDHPVMVALANKAWRWCYVDKIYG